MASNFAVEKLENTLKKYENESSAFVAIMRQREGEGDEEVEKEEEEAEEKEEEESEAVRVAERERRREEMALLENAAFSNSFRASGKREAFDTFRGEAYKDLHSMKMLCHHNLW